MRLPSSRGTSVCVVSPGLRGQFYHPDSCSQARFAANVVSAAFLSAEFHRVDSVRHVHARRLRCLSKFRGIQTIHPGYLGKCAWAAVGPPISVWGSLYLGWWCSAGPGQLFANRRPDRPEHADSLHWLEPASASRQPGPPVGIWRRALEKPARGEHLGSNSPIPCVSGQAELRES